MIKTDCFLLYSKIKYIQIESHNFDMYENKESINKTVKLLQNNSFEVCKIINHSFGDFNDIILLNKAL